MAIDSYARQLAQMAVSNGGTNNNGGSTNESDKTVSSNFIDINNTDYPESNPFDLETLKPGTWIYAPDYQTSGYVKAISPGNGAYRKCKLNTTGYKYSYVYLGILPVGSSKYVTFLRFQPTGVTTGNSNAPSSIKMELFRIFISNNTNPSNDFADFNLIKDAMSSSSNELITGVHNYNKLPTSSVEPTSDNQFTNKKYVDDAISTAITDALGGEY